MANKLIVGGPARNALALVAALRLACGLACEAGGVDILKKLNELSVKVESQQKQIDTLQTQIDELRELIKAK